MSNALQEAISAAKVRINTIKYDTIYMLDESSPTQRDVDAPRIEAMKREKYYLEILVNHAEQTR